MPQYNTDEDDRSNPRWLSDMLKDNEYRIEGDIFELHNVIFSNSRIIVAFRDIISVLSDSRTNYIRVGYGETLPEAYKEATPKEATCRLVHIFLSERDLVGVKELYEFINSFGEDIIFGYTIDNTIGCMVKLVMIFN